MPPLRPAFAVLLMALFGMTCLHSQTDEKAANASWQRVDAAVESVKGLFVGSNPEQLKQAILAYDIQAVEFSRQFPVDRRRWRARLFDGIVLDKRRIAGLPVHEEKGDILKQILQAPDADAEAKSGASAIQVLTAFQTLANDQDRQAWVALAEQHMKAYSVHPANQRIQCQLEEVKNLLAFRGRAWDFKFTAIDGRQVDLPQLRGRVVLIDFWLSTCEQCAGAMPELVRLYEQLRPQGFEIIGVCLDRDRLAVEKGIAANNLPWPQHHDGKAWDGDLVRQCNVHFVPTLWVLDRQGRLACANAHGKLEETIRRLLADPVSGKQIR